MIRLTVLVTLSWFAIAPAALADGPPPNATRPPDAGAAVTGRRLPADVATDHSVELPGRTLRFTATAGALPLVDPTGTAQAELGYVAYTLKGAEPGTRPVTFAINGGPGASSAYLHLLVAGPWRLPLEGGAISPSAAVALVPNPDTWLDFTDLVFIDPVGTGYSRAGGNDNETRERYYNVDGDVSSLAAVIARWLRTNDRLASPKFYLGESYGGFRGPLIAHKLATELGIGLSGLTLVSPALDMGALSEPRYRPGEFMTRLPSMAATAMERAGGGASREKLGEAERYASGEYLADFLRGPGDADAVARMSTRVAALTGLDPALVRRRGGRIDLWTFQREVRRDDGRIVSAYDGTVGGLDPDPAAARVDYEDAILTAISAPLSTAAVDHLWRRLGWRVPNQRYELLNGSVNGAWRWGGGRRSPQAVDDLREILALDPKLQVVVAHGLTDLVTPYYGNALVLRQMPPELARRVALDTYPGGHMFYDRAASRAAFRADAAAMYDRALSARTVQ